jgi:hypothetical protein
MTLSDLTSQLFGRWTVIERASSAKKMTRWKCRCQCGSIKNVYAKALKNGTSTSCGCYAAETARIRETKHGLTGTAEYRTWAKIKSRCFYPDDPDYPDYGGRGITVCRPWLDFAQFIAAMGPRPSARHSIDRIDVNGNYEPSNCRWASPEQQANNKRTNRRISFEGKTMNLVQWAAQTGINADAIYARLDKLHWPVQKALTTPIQKQSN